MKPTVYEIHYCVLHISLDEQIYFQDLQLSLYATVKWALLNN